jgi:hypothetical protein
MGTTRHLIVVRFPGPRETPVKRILAFLNLTVMPLSDFDFLIGRWTVRIRALSASGWCDFEGAYDCRRIGQLGNVAYFRTCCDAFPMEGVSIRLYNPRRDEWTLTWADTSRAGILQPPIIGCFDGGRGAFYGTTEHEGRLMRVRLLWRKTPRPRFEQAFSSNNGRTWETNWTMYFEAKKQIPEVQRPLVAHALACGTDTRAGVR